MREIVTSKDFHQKKKSALDEFKVYAAIEPEKNKAIDKMIDVNKPDKYQDKLLKLIPSEIVGVYLTILGIIKGAFGAITFNDPSGIFIWIVFIFLLIFTPFYLKYIMKVNKVLQIVMTTIAFIIWVLTIGGPFSTLVCGNSKVIPLIGAIVLPLFTLFIPFVFPNGDQPEPKS